MNAFLAGAKNNAFASWRTTLLGAIAMLMIVLPELQSLLDNVPETVIDLNVVAEAIAVFFMGVVARDNGVSSEKSGAA
jgi:surfactin synthase thioesterase subunit